MDIDITTPIIREGDFTDVVGKVQEPMYCGQKKYIKLEYHYTLHDDLAILGREV